MTLYTLRVFFTFLDDGSLDMMIMICVSVNTPKSERMKRARSVTSDTAAGDNEDARSVSSAASGTRTPSRKTPSQVKAENAARKSKVTLITASFNIPLMSYFFRPPHLN